MHKGRNQKKTEKNYENNQKTINRTAASAYFE